MIVVLWWGVTPLTTALWTCHRTLVLAPAHLAEGPLLVKPIMSSGRLAEGYRLEFRTEFNGPAGIESTSRFAPGFRGTFLTKERALNAKHIVEQAQVVTYDSFDPGNAYITSEAPAEIMFTAGVATFLAHVLGIAFLVARRFQVGDTNFSPRLRSLIQFFAALGYPIWFEWYVHSTSDLTLAPALRAWLVTSSLILVLWIPDILRPALNARQRAAR